MLMVSQPPHSIEHINAPGIPYLRYTGIHLKASLSVKNQFFGIIMDSSLLAMISISKKSREYVIVVATAAPNTFKSSTITRMYSNIMWVLVVMNIVASTGL